MTEKRKQYGFLPAALSILALAIFLLTAFPFDAFAASADPQICTDTGSVPNNIQVMSTLTQSIQTVLQTLIESMFTGITGDPDFTYTVTMVLTLYVIIYGILFTFGMVDITYYDFFKRMIKFTIVAGLLDGTMWTYFDSYVIPFFNSGTDDLINVVTNVSVNGTSSPINPGAPPFAALDGIISKAVSVNMIDTILAVFSTGPFGVIMGILLFMSLGSFIRAILTALWVYLMSMVVRTLLFGVAPIFLSCLLFDRTRNLFEGWLNQVVNACLQPILLFAFFAFFAQLVGATMDTVLQNPVCWMEMRGAHVRGASAGTRYWRFEVCNPPGSTTCTPYDGGWSSTGPDNPTDTGGAPLNLPAGFPPFPIGVITVLTFLLLSQLINRINEITTQIAVHLSGATLNLSAMQGAASQAFGKQEPKGGGDSATSSAAVRKTPGGVAGAAGSAVGAAAGDPTATAGVISDATASAGSKMIGPRK